MMHFRIRTQGYLLRSMMCLLLMTLAALSTAKAELSTDPAATRWTLAGFTESTDAVKDLPGYRPLQKVLVGYADDAFIESLRKVAPQVEFVTRVDAGADADQPFDAVLLSCRNKEHLTAAESAAWIHTFSAGVELCLQEPWLTAPQAKYVMTNGSGTAASVIAEHAIAMMMSLARGLHRFRDEQHKPRWSRDLLQNPAVTSTVGGKTMLVLGLGSIGKDVALRANALGMRVLATRNSSRSGPEYVDYVGLADETLDLASQADVIVNALPLTEQTAGLLDEAFFKAMKPTATLISVGRGGTTDTTALLQALRTGAIAGAGLDVTDPEPLPADHPLWQETNVIITPHLAGTGGEARSKTQDLILENLRRYQAGEALLNRVDTKLGY